MWRSCIVRSASMTCITNPVCMLACACRLKTLPVHQPDPNWRFQDHLLHLRQQQHHSWRDIYWLTWGHVNVLYCHHCHQHYPVREYVHCSYHPQTAAFGSESARGGYPCCGRPAWQPGMPLSYSQGCSAREHQSWPAGHKPQADQGLVTTRQRLVGDHSQQNRSDLKASADCSASQSSLLQTASTCHHQHQQQQSQSRQSELRPEQYAISSPEWTLRILELLQRYESLVTVPYSPPPLPELDATDEGAALTALPMLVKLMRKVEQAKEAVAVDQALTGTSSSEGGIGEGQHTGQADVTVYIMYLCMPLLPVEKQLVCAMMPACFSPCVGHC